MTTEQATNCVAPVRPSHPGRDNTPAPCGKPAQWMDASGEPRCTDHAYGHCRRLGKVEGTEA